MFERYTESARRLLFFARFEASEFGSQVIDTEHMLLGLIRVGKGIAHHLLVDAGVSLEQLRVDIDRLSTRAEKIATSVEIPFSDGTRRVLHFAEDEANRLKHSYIGSEHLLLALVRADDTAAGAILGRQGLALDTVRQRLVELMAAPPPSDGPGSARADHVRQIDRIRALIFELKRSMGTLDNNEILERVEMELDTLRGRIGG